MKYKTRDEAEKIAQLRRDEGAGIKVYECEDRDGWHLTSQNAPPPVRPKNAMTQEERGLYSRRKMNRLSDLINEEFASRLKSEIGRNTLESYERKIEQLRLDVAEKVEMIHYRRKQIAILRSDLDSAEQELVAAREDLFSAEHEYEIAKKRINS